MQSVVRVMVSRIGRIRRKIKGGGRGNEGGLRNGMIT